ncbi:MAG: hypothetical protein ACK6CU_31490 [Deltaproteobacteria bacterium]
MSHPTRLLGAFLLPWLSACGVVELVPITSDASTREDASLDSGLTDTGLTDTGLTDTGSLPERTDAGLDAGELARTDTGTSERLDAGEPTGTDAGTEPLDAREPESADTAVVDAAMTDAHSSGPDAAAPDAGRPYHLYYPTRDSLMRLPLGPTGPVGSASVVTAIGTWVTALDLDDAGGRLYWADSDTNEIRAVNTDGTAPALFASTSAYVSLVDALAVDDVARSVLFAGSDGGSPPTGRGPIVRFPVVGGAPTLVTDVAGIEGVQVDGLGRVFSVTDDGRCDVTMRVVRVAGDGTGRRQGAIEPTVRCASIRTAAALVGSDGSTQLYWTHTTAFVTGSCASGARSCVERVRVRDSGSDALTVTDRTSLADADARGAVVGLAVDLARGHLYIARGLSGGDGESYVIVRTGLDGRDEVPITTFSLGRTMYSSFGLPLVVGP